MDWLLLIVAGLFEIAWATAMKASEGFTRVWPTVGMVAAMTVSIVLLGQALKTIPVSAGYAVWTGIGAAGTAMLGMWLFGESREPLRVASIALIVAGIVGVKLS